MNDHVQLLHESAADVLEKMAFMFSDPATPDEIPWRESRFWRAVIRFEGPLKGTIAFFASADFAAVLAANVLGLERRVINNEIAADALKELVNVICGEYCERAGGKQVIFNLTVPQLEIIPVEEARQQAGQADIAVMLVDEMPAFLQLQEEPAPA